MSNNFNKAMPKNKICETSNVCSKYDCKFGWCDEGASNRCTPAERTIITVLASIDEKLSKLLEK